MNVARRLQGRGSRSDCRGRHDGDASHTPGLRLLLRLVGQEGAERGLGAQGTRDELRASNNGAFAVHKARRAPHWARGVLAPTLIGSEHPGRAGQRPRARRSLALIGR